MYSHILNPDTQKLESLKNWTYLCLVYEWSAILIFIPYDNQTGYQMVVPVINLDRFKQKRKFLFIKKWSNLAAWLLDDWLK
jgi:hypothetical protein